MAPPTFSLVVPTEYGQMILNRNDITHAPSLMKTGRSLHHADIMLLTRIVALLGERPLVADVGANFGTYALAMARAVGPGGKVHAFEPQRILFNMLAGSVALNSLLNLHCHHAAVGDREGRIEIPQFDYAKPLEFGSVEFGETQVEKLAQERGNDPAAREYLPLITLDRFGFDRLDLLKIDVEGMEMAVLQGAREVIRRYEPVVFAEFIKSDRHALPQWFLDCGYRAYVSNMNYLFVPKRLQSAIEVSDGRIRVMG